MDVVEQMQGLALKEEADLQEPELKKTNPVFEKSSLSTKVKLKPNFDIKSAELHHSMDPKPDKAFQAG